MWWEWFITFSNFEAKKTGITEKWVNIDIVFQTLPIVCFYVFWRNQTISQPGSIYLDPDTLIVVLCVSISTSMQSNVCLVSRRLVIPLTLQIAENLSHSTSLFLNWYMNHNKTKINGKVHNYIRFLIVCFSILSCTSFVKTVGRIESVML